MPDNQPSPIHLDKSDRSVVIWCEEHPYWRALALDVAHARASAESHERNAHPELSHHADARRQRELYARRHAEASPEMLREPHAVG